MSMRGMAASAAVAVSIAVCGSAAGAAEVIVPMMHIAADGSGYSIGSIRLRDSKNGLLIRFRLNDQVPAGLHGTHVHENPSCAPMEKDGVMVAGLAAGGHYDPGKTGRHEGPSGNGHLGDLPLLYVDTDEDGSKPARHTVVAPRLKVADVLGRSIVIHADGDNYHDTPSPLGGGGGRIACGIVPRTAK